MNNVDENFVEVAIAGTGGRFPSDGFEKIPANQKVEVFLKKAIKQLMLVVGDDWVLKLDTKVIDPEKSYSDNGLTGEFELDFGPDEGGGGRASKII